MPEEEESWVRTNPWTTVTRWLLVANIVISILDWFLIRRNLAFEVDGRPIVQLPMLAMYGHFSWFFAIEQHEYWRFITYQFCHANIEHILVNMMGLLLAGPIVEERLGRIRYLLFYLLCGAAGPVAHLVFGYMGLMSVNEFTPLVGASASIYGILIAAAMIAPNEMVMLAIPPIDIRLKTLAWVMVGLSAAAVIWQWKNAGGHAAHIGGAVVGWILARRMVTPVNAVPEPEQSHTNPP